MDWQVFFDIDIDDGMEKLMGNAPPLPFDLRFRMGDDDALAIAPRNFDMIDDFHLTPPQ